MAKRVLIDEDYLVFLHDQLAENQATLREILGASGADAVLRFESERLVAGIGGNLTFHPIDGVVDRLRGWGMHVRRREEKRSIELKVKCPYAKTVHPHLRAKNPKCPLEEYILGAVRLEYKGASLSTSELLNDGVKLVVSIPADD